MLRPVNDDDSAGVLRWRNHPDVRAVSLTQHEISPTEHAAYWAEERSKGLFATSRVADDGMIDPRDTRDVVGIALSACHSNRVAGAWEYGTWRM